MASRSDLPGDGRKALAVAWIAETDAEFLLEARIRDAL
jgi:hypothetical protein